MAKVFISHSWNDNNISRKLAHELKNDGAKIWIDYARIKPGDTLPERISNALEWCDTLVLVWSKAAANSYWVKKEWQSALTLQKEIIPCIIDDTPLPAILSSFVYINFKDFSQGYDQLLRALELERTKELVTPTEVQTPPRRKIKIPTKKIMKISAILLAIVMLGFMVNFTAQKISSARAAKRAYWQKRQSEMDTRFEQAKQSDGDTQKSASDKLKIWQQFSTDFAADNPYSQQDNAQRQYADDRISYYKPAQITVKGMTLVLIPGGTFDRGDTFGDGYDDEKPVHSVTVSDFYMGSKEVTVAQYRSFCQATGRQMPKAPRWGWQDNHPIVNVSWHDAMAFCQWAGCRLPTEAEWEYAAREGGKKIKWSGTNNMASLGDYAWYSNNSGSQTHPVGTKKPNALGLYDMSGNVWEWCSDWYDSDYYKNSPRNNPKGPSSSPSNARVLRGGSYYYLPWYARSAFRNRNVPDNRSDNAGFRVVQDSPH